MPRLRTLVIAAAVIVGTDVTWNGTSLNVSFGWPGRKPIASLVFPRADDGPTTCRQGSRTTEATAEVRSSRRRFQRFDDSCTSVSGMTRERQTGIDGTWLTPWGGSEA
jgi:hypothetical protein